MTVRDQGGIVSCGARLLGALDALERKGKALAALVDGRSLDQLARAPGPDEWSVAQVFLHLAIAEEMAAAYIARKRGFGGARRATVLSALRFRALRLAFVLPIKFKAPKGLGELPRIGFEAAHDRWERAGRALQELLLSVPEREVGLELFKHPAAGKLDLVQGVRSMTIHFDRHTKQVKRILQQVQRQASP